MTKRIVEASLSGIEVESTDEYQITVSANANLIRITERDFSNRSTDVVEFSPKIAGRFNNAVIRAAKLRGSAEIEIASTSFSQIVVKKRRGLIRIIKRDLENRKSSIVEIGVQNIKRLTAAVRKVARTLRPSKPTNERTGTNKMPSYRNISEAGKRDQFGRLPPKTGRIGRKSVEGFDRITTVTLKSGEELRLFKQEIREIVAWVKKSKQGESISFRTEDDSIPETRVSLRRGKIFLDQLGSVISFTLEELIQLRAFANKSTLDESVEHNTHASLIEAAKTGRIGKKSLSGDGKITTVTVGRSKVRLFKQEVREIVAWAKKAKNGDRTSFRVEVFDTPETRVQMSKGKIFMSQASGGAISFTLEELIQLRAFANKSTLDESTINERTLNESPELFIKSKFGNPTLRVTVFDEVTDIEQGDAEVSLTKSEIAKTIAFLRKNLTNEGAELVIPGRFGNDPTVLTIFDELVDIDQGNNVVSIELDELLKVQKFAKANALDEAVEHNIHKSLIEGVNEVIGSKRN